MSHMYKTGIYTLAMALMLVACQKKTTTTTSNSSNLGTTTGTWYGGTTAGTTTGTTTSSTTTGGSVTAGNTSGGGGTSTGGGQIGSPFPTNVVMAGGQNWYHGFYPGGTSNLLGTFMQILSGNYGFLAGDARYKVKVTVLDQPTVTGTSNGTVCFGRIAGSQPYFWYTKLKFNVGIRDIYCTSADPLNCTSFSIGTRYNSYMSPILSVGSSHVFDFSNLRSRAPNIVGHSVEVWNVMSDSATCDAPSSSCNPNGLVSNRSCWSVDLAVATDSTTDL